MVLKLAGGIISENVRLLRNRDDAEYWIKRLFGSGVTSLDRPSLRRPRALLRRALTAAEAITGGHRRRSRRGDVQRGYFLVQEFLEGNDYDTRAVAIGNRAYAYRRFNRPDDFRASGSGLRDPDPSQIDLELVRMAFVVARSLGTQSIAIDGIYRGEERVLTEISYYYEGWILHEECPGHWLLNGTPEQGSLEWVEGSLRPEDGILDDFLEGLADPDRAQTSSDLTSG